MQRIDFCELFWNGSCFALIAIKSKGFEIIAYKNEMKWKAMFPIACSLWFFAIIPCTIYPRQLCIHSDNSIRFWFNLFYISLSLSKLMRVSQKITWMIKHCLCLCILSPPQSNISISCGLLNYIIWDINTIGAGEGQESKPCPSHRTWRQFWKGLRPAMELLFRCPSHTTQPQTSSLSSKKIIIIFTNTLMTNRNIPVI